MPPVVRREPPETRCPYISSPRWASVHVMIGGWKLHVDSWTTLPSTTVSIERIFLISTSGTEK
jgi:hypothetical protein